jgi:DNA-binding protein HU-beta
MANKPLPLGQLIADIAEEADVPKNTARSVLESFVEVMLGEIEEGYPVSLPGIMKIYPAARGPQKARMGRNPATGEALEIAAQPASIQVRVRVLKDLKSAAPSIKSEAGKELLAEYKGKNKK